MLSEDLSNLKAHFKTIAPPEIFDVLEASTKTEAGDGVATVGSTLPDFKLPDATGKQVSLDELLPAVLVFYRGAWCPYCNLALHAYQQEVLPQLENVRFAAISPQPPDGSLATNDLAFPVLTDTANTVAGSLGITFRPADDVKRAMSSIGIPEQPELPHPTVVVVDRARTIRFIDVHPDYTTRTDSAEILAAAAQL
ncbi:Peroxiredoxin [Amycolatopsis xylanica]|uniref:thioredoxin-dependent peroxiredoxin n=1 Tax=Amycolatopsis xylanica TaxID=589385 RepID=A0A1H2ZDU5_9PSEU|nr:peroxiredoxin-like family protein [Amycolatopsis xylanica]SDX15497.1 Peroxiredoxin [Amycolatopsis xylanica]